MSNNEQPFKIGFPCLRMPVSHGGKRAAVIMSVMDPNNKSVVYCTCIDVTGRVFQQVPFVAGELFKAAEKPVFFLEVKELNAPLVKTAG